MKINKNKFGFTLIEIMVGLIIGMFVSLAAYSTLNYFNSTAKNSANYNNALQSSVVGMNVLASDIKNAGLGMHAGDTVLCSRINMPFADGTVQYDGVDIGPVLLDGSGASDVISVSYSDSIKSGAVSELLQLMTADNSDYLVNKGSNFANGNVVIISDENNEFPCTVATVTAVANKITTPKGSLLSHGVPAYATPARYRVGSYVSLFSNFIWSEYSLNGSGLSLKNKLDDASYDLLDNVVGLRTQYGITNGTSNTVSTWVDPVGADWGFGNVSIDNKSRIRAIRVSMLVRSGMPSEKLDGSCSTTNVLPEPWAGAAVAFDGIDTVANWDCYKYKLLSEIIPVKNIIYGYNY